MPLTLDQAEKRIIELERRLDRTMTLLNEAQQRIVALEKPNLGAQMQRIGDAMESLVKVAKGPFHGVAK